MRLQTCIKTCFFVSILSFICLATDSVSTSVSVKDTDSASSSASLEQIGLASSSILEKETDLDPAFISMAGDCRYPAISSKDNILHLTWIVTEGVNTSVYYRRSSDEGKSWTSSRQISNEHGDCHPPTIAVNSGTVHLAWVDYAETIDGEVYYTRSLDGGETWEKNRILITDANSSRYPLLACKGNNVYLIRQDVENKVYFMASHDQGLTWETEILLGKVGKHSCYCYPPAIASRGNELVVVWSDLSADKRGLKFGVNGLNPFKSKDKVISSVVCRKSTDSGRTWNRPQVLSAIPLSKETKEEIDNPILLADSSHFFLFWLDRRDLILGEIFYARFDPKTVKFPIDGKKVFPIQKRSPKRPSVVFDNEGNLHLTWANFFNNESVVSYGKISPAGNPLTEKSDLTTRAGSYHNPVMTRTTSGFLHIFWYAVPKDGNGWSRIFFKTSKNNGTTWENWDPPKRDM